MARDKRNLDIFCLKDDALDDPDLPPPPDEVAAEVVESLESALASGLLPTSYTTSGDTTGRRARRNRPQTARLPRGTPAHVPLEPALGFPSNTQISPKTRVASRRLFPSMKTRRRTAA
jgi:hypothetical protein